MNRIDERLVGICGIYCGDCPSFLAPRLEDRSEMARLGEIKGLKAGEVWCDGCLSDRLMPGCVECKHGFRDCAAEHQVPGCHDCPELPCDRLKAFLPIHVVEGVSHHEKLIEELSCIREHGTRSWLEKRAGESVCGQCRRPLYWYSKSCPDCGRMR